MLRNISGSLLALIGAVLAVWSPFRIWYGGRLGSDVRVDDLFTGVGVTPAGAALLGSLFLPMGFAGLLALLGVLLRSPVAMGAAGVLVLGVTVLWMVRQGQAAGSLTAGGDGLDVGVAAAVGGGALLLLGAAVMPGRTAPRYGEPSPAYEPRKPYGPPVQDQPVPPPVPPPVQHPPVQHPPVQHPPVYEAGHAPGQVSSGAQGAAPLDPGYRPEDDETLTLPPLPDRPPG